MRIEDVRALLQKACDAAGGLRAFGREHGVSVQYVSKVLANEKPPSDLICKALGIKADGMRWVRR